MGIFDGISNEDRSIIGYIRDSGTPYVVSCTINHALKTTSGHPSRHRQQGTNGEGLAVDIVGPHGERLNNELLYIWQEFAKVESQLYELIYKGAPYQIKAGQHQPASFYGAAVMSQHDDHVHVAVNRGTALHFPKPTHSIPIGDTAVKMLATKTGLGYYIFHADGSVHCHGDARNFGSMAGKPLTKPITGAALTLTGNGYWEVAADGGVFTFGDAQFYGSMGGEPLNEEISDIEPTQTGHGYWLLGRDGGIFSFGDAQFFGSDVG